MRERVLARDFLQMRDNEQWETDEHPTSPSADSGRDVVGRLIGDEEEEEERGHQYGRETPEESTFDRQGPLTIPEVRDSGSTKVIRVTYQGAGSLRLNLFFSPRTSPRLRMISPSSRRLSPTIISK